MAKRKVVYSQTVIDFIKEAIKKQRLLPGQKVCEQSIASEMNLSRAPVREALNVLLGEGLVISGPHLGKRVTALSMQEIHDAYTLAGAVSGVMLAASIPQYTAKDYAQFEVIAQGLKEQSEKGAYKYEDYDRLRQRLHELALQYAFKRWDMRLLVYCGNLSAYLLHKTHREVLLPADYLCYAESLLRNIKNKDAQTLESETRVFFDLLGRRLSVAGYDHHAIEQNFVLDKKFHMHKRRQLAAKIPV